MTRHNTFSKCIFSAVALLAATLACTIFIGGPDYPEPPILVSTEAVVLLNEEIKSALETGAVSGEVTLMITEPQLTSYLAFKLQSQTNPVITKPQVYLRDNQIRVYGTAQSGYFQVTTSVFLTAKVDDQAHLAIEITSVDFGPLPIPAELKDGLTAIITEAYTGALGPVATGFRLESISISDGTMSLTGRIK